MSKWLVWISESVGVYIHAHRVVEEGGKVSFVKITPTMDVVVATYNAKDIRYSKVE